MRKRFQTGSEGPDRAVAARRLSVATLLVEIARADFAVDSTERAAIRRMLTAAYGLDSESAAELVASAERTAEESVSLYDFTRRLNEELSPKEKVEIVGMLWRVAYADGRLDKYEEHLVRKAADLLYVPHRHFIRTKLESERDRPRDPPGSEPSSR